MSRGAKVGSPCSKPSLSSSFWGCWLWASAAGWRPAWHYGAPSSGASARRPNLDTSARLLRNLLTGIAVSPVAGLAGIAGDSGFKGDAEHVKFIGDLPTGLGTRRRADIALGLHKGNLVLTWTPHLHEILLGSPPPPTDTELVAKVARLDIAYWGSTATDQSAAWQARWDGPAPPQLVRIRLVFAKGDRRRWPDLIAAPVL